MLHKGQDDDDKQRGEGDKLAHVDEPDGSERRKLADCAWPCKLPNRRSAFGRDVEDGRVSRCPSIAGEVPTRLRLHSAPKPGAVPVRRC
jgi:hypothetical protein